MSDNHVPQGTGAAMSPNLGEPVQPAPTHVRERRYEAVPEWSDTATTTALVSPPIKAVPLSGLRAVLYKLLLAFGVELLMKRSRGDRKVLDAAHEEASEINRNFDEMHRREQVRSESYVELRKQTDNVGSAIFAFFNTKGASGTTTTTVHFSAVLAEVSRTLVSLIDGNPAAGTCAARLGKNDGETVTIQQLASDLKGDRDLARRSFRDEMSKARPSENGVRVISADPIIQEQRRLSGEGMGNVLSLLSAMSEFVTIDTANDIGDVPMKEVARRADVFIFTANVAIPDSLRKLATSMETMRALGHHEKVNKSVVVISNIPEGKTAEDYRRFLNEVDFEDHVVRRLEQLFDGIFMGVHHDPYIALDRVVDLGKLQWHSLQSYVNMAISALCQAQVLRSQKPSISRVAELPVQQSS